MSDRLSHRYRNVASVLLKDWARYRRALAAPGSEYLALCNRREQLESAADGTGYRCLWQWTSDLHAPKYLRSLGAAIMRRALQDHPVRRARSFDTTKPPELSFIIGHRGLDRLPHLLATLESIAGQADAAVECIVVEQDNEPLLTGRLPSWVRLVHTPLPRRDLPYCRSWAFNIGVQHARTKALILHDNDMLVPSDYAAQVLRLMRQGFEVINLKRFIFYLTRPHTEGFFSGGLELTEEAPMTIVQNLEGGGSVAITRAAYEDIGGFDEAFIGWGGEDVEFWERASSRRVWPYACLPLVHLWHRAQPGKASDDSNALRLYYSLAKTPVEQRIERLRERRRGAQSGPAAGDAIA